MLKGRFLNLKTIEIHLKMIDCKLTLHEPVRKITPSKIWLYLKKKEEEINTLTKSVIEYLQSAEEKMAIYGGKAKLNIDLAALLSDRERENKETCQMKWRMAGSWRHGYGRWWGPMFTYICK